MFEVDKIICGECIDVMQSMEDECVELTVTSPPYDKLREYKGYSFNFEGIAGHIFRVTKQGGVVVWVVGDATVDGSETGTSFRQAMHFKEIGFNLHDTMIYAKPGFSAVGALKTRYAPVFEYMFVFSKGKIKTFNPIKDRRNKCFGTSGRGTIRQKDGTTKPMSKVITIGEFGQRFNIWKITPQKQGGHPALFPEQLARDHIISWSNKGDLVFDPMCGSGTTPKMAVRTGRHFIGIEVSPEYCKIAETRIQDERDKCV